MKQVKQLNNQKIYTQLFEILRIGNQAVKAAKEENKKFGIPEMFVKNDTIYYILENGEISKERPDLVHKKQ